MTYTNFLTKSKFHFNKIFLIFNNKFYKGESSTLNFISIYGGAMNKNEKWGYWNQNPESAILRTLCVFRCPKGFQ